MLAPKHSHLFINFCSFQKNNICVRDCSVSFKFLQNIKDLSVHIGLRFGHFSRRTKWSGRSSRRATANTTAALMNYSCSNRVIIIIREFRVVNQFTYLFFFLSFGRLCGRWQRRCVYQQKQQPCTISLSFRLLMDARVLTYNSIWKDEK